ncbi:hypothetical protein VP01_1065g6 [Puccinia sorghi]|uniref:Uncharacterized protein n=1 Tax=Puccinia sorghi TaxID=27349 RepID=A0A0L6VTR5_9BASI|nr:hypothetical protein VP01_1065g6 [Puccinia sorghi]
MKTLMTASLIQSVMRHANTIKKRIISNHLEHDIKSLAWNHLIPSSSSLVAFFHEDGNIIIKSSSHARGQERNYIPFLIPTQQPHGQRNKLIWIGCIDETWQIRQTMDAPAVVSGSVNSFPPFCFCLSKVSAFFFSNNRKTSVGSFSTKVIVNFSPMPLPTPPRTPQINWLFLVLLFYSPQIVLHGESLWGWGCWHFTSVIICVEFSTTQRINSSGLCDMSCVTWGGAQSELNLKPPNWLGFGLFRSFSIFNHNGNSFFKYQDSSRTVKSPSLPLNHQQPSDQPHFSYSDLLSFLARLSSLILAVFFFFLSSFFFSFLFLVVKSRIFPLQQSDSEPFTSLLLLQIVLILIILIVLSGMLHSFFYSCSFLACFFIDFLFFLVWSSPSTPTKGTKRKRKMPPTRGPINKHLMTVIENSSDELRIKKNLALMNWERKKRKDCEIFISSLMKQTEHHSSLGSELECIDQCNGSTCKLVWLPLRSGGSRTMLGDV